MVSYELLLILKLEFADRLTAIQKHISLSTFIGHIRIELGIAKPLLILQLALIGGVFLFEFKFWQRHFIFVISLRALNIDQRFFRQFPLVHSFSSIDRDQLQAAIRKPA